MGRYDNNIKCAELRRLLEARNYKKAYMILETIDVDAVKNVTELNAFAEVYRKAGKYEEAKEMLEIVYERTNSKMVLYKLANLAVLRGKYEEAEELLKEYIERNPDGEERYILRYRIEKAKGADYETRIACLERLRAYEYIEEWAYELATLYHKAAKAYHKMEEYDKETEMIEKCVEECSDIVLWFGEGVIVEKAKLLRMYHLEGSEALERYGVDLEKARQRVKEQSELSQNQGMMKTKELAAQISEFAEAERKSDLKKELAQELLPTMDIQQAMKRDLNIGETADVKEEIARMLEEEEKKARRHDTDVWIFEKNEKERVEELEDELEAQKRNEGKRKSLFGFRKKDRMGNTADNAVTGSIRKLQEAIRMDRLEVEGKTETVSKEAEISKAEEPKKENFVKKVMDDPKDAGDWNVRIDENEWDSAWAENKTALQEPSERTAETYRPEQSPFVQEDPEKDWRAESEWQYRNENTAALDSVEAMIVKKKVGQDSSVIPVEEIKAALFALNKEAALDFEEIEEEDEIKEKAAEEEPPVEKAKIEIHYGERYKDFVKDYDEAEGDSASGNPGMEGEEAVLQEKGEVELSGQDEAFSEDEDHPVRAGIDLDKSFAGFMQHYSIRRQIINVFTEIEEHEDWKKHFIITGDPKTGKTTLAKNIAKVMNKMGVIHQMRFAKTTGNELNKMNLEEKKDRLKGACLIVERAGDMYRPTIRSMIALMDELDGNFVIILEDDQTSMERFLLENYDIQDYFHYTFKL